LEALVVAELSRAFGYAWPRLKDGPKSKANFIAKDSFCQAFGHGSPGQGLRRRTQHPLANIE